ncbi:serine acetyltransferase, partial [Pseudomonas syringae]
MIPLWQRLRKQAHHSSERNPALGEYAKSHLLAYETFEAALAANLARQIQAQARNVALESWFKPTIDANPGIAEAAAADLHHLACVHPACPDHLTASRTLSGFLPAHAYRIAPALRAAGGGHSAG